MRNMRKSGQRLRSKKRPRPTLGNGRGSRTNSNTSHQNPARVIEAENARGGGCQTRDRPKWSIGRSSSRDHELFNRLARGSQGHFHSWLVLVRVTVFERHRGALYIRSAEFGGSDVRP